VKIQIEEDLTTGDLKVTIEARVSRAEAEESTVHWADKLTDDILKQLEVLAAINFDQKVPQ
jgi:hypothetical protein